MRISDWSSDVCSSDLLQVNRFLERGAYIFQFVDHDAFGAHGFGDSGEALVVELSGDEAAIVEINLVFLFRAPLAIVEDQRGNRNDRKGVVEGKSWSGRVDLGGRSIIKKKNKTD